MTHLREEDMVLRYYDETEDLRQMDGHLAECAECRQQFDELSKALQAMTAVEVPERDESYGAQVWARIQPRLLDNHSGSDFGEALSGGRNHSRSGFWRHWLAGFATWPRLALAGGMAALVVAAFVAGRYWPAPVTTPAAPARAEATSPAVRERILLIAVGEHLDRSQMVLAELGNMDPSASADISVEQDFARDLVASNRLYRQAALRDGKTAVADVLDELERVLVDIANSPATASPADLERLRDRLEERGLIFKVKVLGSQMKRDASRPAGTPARSASSS